MAKNNAHKAPCDPGWNDPPLFSYDFHKSHGKKTSLNRRLNYSLDGDIDTHKSIVLNNDGKLPPATVGPPLSLRTNKVTESTNSDHQPINIPFEPVELSVVLKNLQTTMNDIYHDEKEKEISEVKRRLTLMENLWKDGKFPEDVKQKLGNISEALQENDLTACDNLQRSLMVDHTSLCSSWMAAIRLLINSKRKFHENKTKC